MPHAIVEWTDNLADEFAIRDLLAVVAEELRNSDGVFPFGGIRVRSVRYTDYVIADGQADDAFVNITVKMGAGRSEEFKQVFFARVFERIKQFFEDIYKRRYLALSLYVEEFDEKGSYKMNNLHTRFQKVD